MLNILPGPNTAFTLSGGITESDIVKKLFPSLGQSKLPPVPPRSTWLTLIAIFFSRR